MLCKYIKDLLAYAMDCKLLPACEESYARNLLLDLFQETNFEEPPAYERIINLECILSHLLEEAISRKLIEDTITERDLFDTKIMNCLVPRPSQVQANFAVAYKRSPKEATDYFYKLSQDSDYIRRYRIQKDRKWNVNSPYGKIDITINLSKPEKDPKAIAAAKNTVSNSYPSCLLCAENEGYMGHTNHPARQNHRIIPITMNHDDWGFQYSPYVYYNEHCIVFSKKHVPMKMEEATFRKLFDFVSIFPHYFLGSNADLPIVGGSILSHDHFQGGNYTFAMETAKIETHFVIPGYEEVEAGIVQWPLSVIRLRSKDKESLIKLSTYILDQWRNYTDEDAFIFSHTEDVLHNTITPIVRIKDDKFEIDLALRNNITTSEHPLGVYHPHADLHHIKKENIGLIEVMGLAVLPARLKEEMELLAQALLQKKDISKDPILSKHLDWSNNLKEKYQDFTAESIMSILETEIGNVFVRVLEDAGVFKCNEQGRKSFMKFIRSL